MCRMPQRHSSSPSQGDLHFPSPLDLVHILFHLVYVVLSLPKVLLGPHPMPRQPHPCDAGVEDLHSVWLDSESCLLPPSDVFIEYPSADLTE